MRNRISAYGLLFHHDALLLIKHVHPQTGFTWWVPPGGGVKGVESVFDAVVRECKEEANVDVKATKIAYLRQFLYTAQEENNIALYLVCEWSGDVSTANLAAANTHDAHYIKEAHFFTQEQMQELTVFPEALKTVLWQDRNDGFSAIRFLGVETDLK